MILPAIGPTFSGQERTRTTDGKWESGKAFVWGQCAGAITCSHCCMAGRVMDWRDVEGAEWEKRKRRRREEEVDARRGRLRNESGKAGVRFSGRSFFYH